MMNKLWAPMVCVLALIVPLAAAQGVAVGGVERIAVSTGSRIALVRMKVQISERIPCHTSPDWDFALSLFTPQGRAIYATLVAAQQTGSVVTLVGKASCDLVSDIETIDWLTMP